MSYDKLNDQTEVEIAGWNARNLPSECDYDSARAQLGPWASDEQITRLAYQLRDARRLQR